MAYKKTLNFSYFVIKALYPPRGAKHAIKSHINDKINHFLSLRLVEITKGEKFN